MRQAAHGVYVAVVIRSLGMQPLTFSGNSFLAGTYILAKDIMRLSMGGFSLKKNCPQNLCRFFM